MRGCKKCACCVSLAGAMVLAVAASPASAFTDGFTNNSYTQSNWVFVDILTGPTIRPTTGVASSGSLTVTALALPGGSDPARHLVGAYANAEFDGPYTRARGAMVWSELEYSLGIRKGLFVGGNIASRNCHMFTVEPGGIGIPTQGDVRLERIVGGGMRNTESTGASIVSGPGVVYQLEFGQFGNFLWGKVWTTDYNQPLVQVSGYNSDIPWGLGDGNTLAGFGAMLDQDRGSSAYAGSFTSEFLVNSGLGCFEIATSPDGSGAAGEEDQTSVPTGSNQTVTVLGTSGDSGYVQATFESTTSAGELSVAYAAMDQADLPIADFAIPGDTMQVWEIDFDGAFDGAIELTLTYDDTNILPQDEPFLSVFHYEIDHWVELDGIVDTVDNTITVTTTSLSPFALGVVPEPTTLLLLIAGGLAMVRPRRMPRPR